jgi:hypothetical protein
MRNAQIKILDADDSKTETGAAFWVGQVYSASFCPICGDAGANGTVKIQGSNDIPTGAPAAFTPTNWNDITSATSAIASGVGPAIVITNLNFAYIRAVYTSSSGARRQ